jgi:hypothetical protein
MKKEKAKKMTMRQQMRVKAEKKLDFLVGDMFELAKEVCKDEPIDAVDLMHLCSTSQTKTLQNKLVTRITNRDEADFLKFWNDQQELPLKVEESGGDDVS